jgi:ribosome-associated protein
MAALDDLKALDLHFIDLTHKASFADSMIIAGGTSSRHVAGLAQAVLAALARQGRRPLGVEGLPHAEWVCIDAGDTVVHLLTPAAREHYKLEKLWSYPFPVVEGC